MEKDITKLLRLYQTGNIAMVQTDTEAGNLEYNAKQIINYITKAKNFGLDLIIFPEFSLPGFPLEDIISRHPFILDENVKWLKQISKIANNITAIVGFIEPVKDENKYYSSVAVLSNGKIQTIIRKTQVPQIANSNDYKYILPANISEPKYFDKTIKNVISVNGKKYGITIGEDYLNNEILENLSANNPDIIINCSASLALSEQEHMKQNIFSYISKKYSKPIVYVNQTGATDIYSFAGVSRVYNSEGNIIAQAKSFSKDFMVVNPFQNFGKIQTLPNGLVAEKQESFSLNYDLDMERTYQIVIQGIRDYFRKTGFKRAVLGLSGGLDSTVCAVLLVDALGAENVLGVSMPSKITSNESKSDAQKLAQNLGINFIEVPIKQMFDAANSTLQIAFESIEKQWNGRYEQSFTPDNIQARSRAVILWCISNEFSSTLPIATSDKSEKYVGYATINGDMSGGFAPIADITKTKLFALAKWLNKNREIKNVIPESVILKRPGAELAIDPKTGKPLIAEDALMPYEFLDEIIWRIENKNENYNQMLESEFLYEKSNKITKEQKIEWLDKFYRRMSTALYKWTILPPFVVVDSKNCNYKQPITSSHIDYKGLSEESIEIKIGEFIKNIK